MYFELPIDPKSLSTAQQKGINWVTHRVYTKNKVRQSLTRLREAFTASYRETFKAISAEFNRLEAARDNLREYLPTEEEVAEHPWYFHVEFIYGTTKPKLYGCYKVTRPDGDNLVKLVLDALTASGILWRDDSQVQIFGAQRSYIVRKSDTPCIRIHARPMARGARL